MKRRIILLCLLILCTGAFLQLHSDVSVPLHRSLEYFPTQVGQWRMVHEWRFDEDVLETLKATGYVSRLYKYPSGRTVELYLGYHDGGPDAGPIHSPRNCLPGGGWFKRSEKLVRFDAGSRSLKGVLAAYEKGEQTVTMLYWFQVCGRIVTNEYALKLGEIFGSMTSNRRDSAFIRLSTNDGGDADAPGMLEEFAKDFYPVIEQFLPKPAGRR